MKLISLSLKGFRQHKDTSLEFKTGLTGIIGNNGSGKSTLIEAIAFCFYGSKAIRGKMDQVRTLGLSNKQEVKASLLFEHDGVNYRLERSLNDASLFVGGESEAYITGNVEVSQKITSIFAMNYEEFAATFFTEQKGLEFLSGRKGATERERFIVRLMGYDKLQEIQELLRSDRKDKKNSIGAWEASLGDRGKIVETIQTEEKELGIVKDKHLEAQRILDNAEKEVVKNKKAFEISNQNYQNFLKIKQDLNVMQIRFDEKNKRLDFLGTKINSLGTNSSALKEISNLLKGITAFPMDLKASAHDLASDVEKYLEVSSAKVEDLNEKVSAGKNVLLEKQLNIKASLQAITGQIESLSSKNSKLLALQEDSACPTCGQELGATLLSVKGSLKAELKDLEKLLEDKKDELKLINADTDSITSNSDLLENVKAQVKVLKEAKNNLQKITVSEKEIEGLEQESKVLNAELLSLQESLKKGKADLGRLNINEESYQSSKTQYETTQRLMELARLQRLKVEGEADKFSALLQRSKAALAEFDAKSMSLENARKDLIVLEKSDQILTELRKHLNAQLRPRLSQLASQYLSELSDGRYSTVEISQDFSPRVLEDGEIKTVISGGEEDLLNLCLRLALSNMLAERAGLSFSTLILDEVFGALDDNRRNNVLMLLEKLSKRFEQILVITHLEDIRDGVHNLISINYNDSTSELEIVDRMNFEDNDAVVNI